MQLSAKTLCLLALGGLWGPAARADRALGTDADIISNFPFAPAVIRVNRLQDNAAFGPGAKIDPQQLPCPGGNVIAATPGQSTKTYHVDAVVIYNQIKVPGDRSGAPAAADRPGILTGNSSACKVTQNGGSTMPDGSKHCLAAKTGRYVMLSDYFYCTNGQDLAFYRGYWEGADLLDTFNAHNPVNNSENEHGLTNALGRGDISHINPGDSFRTFDAGPTFPVEKTRFLFFTPATTDDILRIDAAVSFGAGASGTYVQCKDGTFAVRASGGCAK